MERVLPLEKGWLDRNLGHWKFLVVLFGLGAAGLAATWIGLAIHYGDIVFPMLPMGAIMLFFAYISRRCLRKMREILAYFHTRNVEGTWLLHFPIEKEWYYADEFGSKIDPLDALTGGKEFDGKEGILVHTTSGVGYYIHFAARSEDGLGTDASGHVLKAFKLEPVFHKSGALYRDRCRWRSSGGKSHLVELPYQELLAALRGLGSGAHVGGIIGMAHIHGSEIDRLRERNEELVAAAHAKDLVARILALRLLATMSALSIVDKTGVTQRELRVEAATFALPFVQQAFGDSNLWTSLCEALADPRCNDMFNRDATEALLRVKKPDSDEVLDVIEEALDAYDRRREARERSEATQSE